MISDRKRQSRDAKLRVIQLIDEWVARTGLKRENLAKIAGLPEYNLFYKAYLDTTRGVSRDPERALGVVRAVTEGLPQERRATAGEVLRFLAETRFPHDRIGEIAALFTPGEWEAASGQREAAATTQNTPGPAFSEAFTERLTQLEEAIRRLSVGSGEEEVLAAATMRLAAMPEDIPDVQALPVPHRMPLIRGKLFTGRNDELRQLIKLLRTQSPGEIIAITGMGGVGKTSLASELVHRCGHYFAGGVFWLNFAQAPTIAWEVAACGEAGLVQHEEWSTLPIEARARLVTLAWQAPLPRLLIFDGCEDYATLQQWRPTSGGCRVVLTSQRSHWSQSLAITTVSLRELTSDTSVALLQSYRPDLPSHTPALHTIAHEVGGLPLALHLAGSYLETYQHDPLFGDPERFVQNLRAVGPLANPALSGIDVAQSPTDHELSIGRTFALSLARLDQRDERAQSARMLLARAAYLAPGEPFSPEVLAATTQEGDAARPAIASLANLGLITQTEQTLRIHQLVAAYARSALADEAAPGDVRRALVRQTELAYAQRNPSAARQILPHLALHADAEPLPVLEESVLLWNSIPFLLELSGELASGLRYLERAHNALLQAETIETPLGAQVLNNLAEWRRALGEPAAARQFHEQALAIRSTLLPSDDLLIAESRLNLGDTLRELGELEQARQAYELALAIAQQRGGPAHEIALAARNHLALLHFTRKQYSEAREQFEALSAATGAAFGEEDPRTATVRNNLATTLARLGEYDRARAEYAAVVAILGQSLGEEHPQTLQARVNAAKALVLSGSPEGAVDELRRLIDLLTAAFGADHPLVQAAQATLAQAEAQQPSTDAAPQE